MPQKSSQDAGVSQWCIRKILRRNRETGRPHRGKYGGSMKISTPREDRQLQRMVRTNRFISAPRLRMRMIRRFGRRMSVRTIRRRLLACRILVSTLSWTNTNYVQTPPSPMATFDSSGSGYTDAGSWLHPPRPAHSSPYGGRVEPHTMTDGPRFPSLGWTQASASPFAYGAPGPDRHCGIGGTGTHHWRYSVSIETKVYKGNLCFCFYIFNIYYYQWLIQGEQFFSHSHSVLSLWCIITCVSANGVKYDAIVKNVPWVSMYFCILYVFVTIKQFAIQILKSCHIIFRCHLSNFEVTQAEKLTF